MRGLVWAARAGVAVARAAIRVATRIRDAVRSDVIRTVVRRRRVRVPTRIFSHPAIAEGVAGED